jgi:hypothetical protein
MEVKTMSDINTDQPVYLQVRDAVLLYPYGCGRQAIADQFRVTKTTAAEHLEKCVRLGLLRKFYGWLSKNSRGWIYINPDVAPNAFRSDQDHDDEQPADLIHDDRFRQLDNLQTAIERLDELADLPDDKLDDAVMHMAYDPNADDYRRF